jgi:hypothetical protein
VAVPFAAAASRVADHLSGGRAVNLTHYLANLTSTATDDEIAAAIADHLLRVDNPAGPFKLAYEHPAWDRPPPIPCDHIERSATLCSIERADPKWCRDWLLKVLRAGLLVHRFAGRGFYQPVAGASIKTARESIRTRERMAAFDATRTAPDGYLDNDEIPF